ncbi:unnamed protein product [Lactuca virosa]|uniref:Protein kinase domain-containing protein n=1 Tax=Lactuca virosa TaxID=75947 RepID=A0AAU9MVI3_9ASTR|nr:unnamed protein product [Lactuca virosa]
MEIPLTDILSNTNNFAKTHLIRSGANGELYKAELDHFDSKKFLSFEKKNEGELPKKRSIVAIKRILNKEGEKRFHAEIEMLSNCKHPNIVSLLGFCEEDGHMILVYEHASNGSLDDYLGSTCNLTNLTWVQRIKICIDVARGLNYLHQKVDVELRMILFYIKSGNILLGENWEAKIAGFGLSKIHPEDQQLNALYTKEIAGIHVYLENETNIYSFGVVLFEVLSGRLANDPIYTIENSQGIGPIARRRFNEATVKDMIDPRLMEEIHGNFTTLNRGTNEDSMDAFLKIAYQCLTETPTHRLTPEVIVRKLEEALYIQENIKDHLKFSFEDIKEARPTTGEVLLQLKQALESQEDYEIWEPRLPNDYKEIIEMSNSREIYLTEKKKALYDILSNGILLQEGKTLLTLCDNGERNEMISAKTFSYINPSLHRWCSIPESRFSEVIELLPQQVFRINCKIENQMLSRDIEYVCYLVFKISKKCHGLHCPVKVRDLLHWSDEEAEILYFRTPRPWNLHDTNQAPKQRADGWMEVKAWKLNLNHEFKDDHFHVNLRLISYEGTMSGLIVCGLEFRPM